MYPWMSLQSISVSYFASWLKGNRCLQSVIYWAAFRKKNMNLNLVGGLVHLIEDLKINLFFSTLFRWFIHPICCLEIVSEGCSNTPGHVLYLCAKRQKTKHKSIKNFHTAAFPLKFSMKLMLLFLKRTTQSKSNLFSPEKHIKLIKQGKKALLTNWTTT